MEGDESRRQDQRAEMAEVLERLQQAPQARRLIISIPRCPRAPWASPKTNTRAFRHGIGLIAGKQSPMGAALTPRTEGVGEKLRSSGILPPSQLTCRLATNVRSTRA